MKGTISKEKIIVSRTLLNKEELFFLIFIFTHNQPEINHSVCRNKDCE